MKALTTSLKKQYGASMGAIIINVGILIFIGFAVSKVAVFYFDNRLVNESLQSLDDVPYLTKKSQRELQDLLNKRLQMNNISLNANEVVIDKRTDKLTIKTVYERRANLFANIDVVVRFENEYQAANR